MTELRGDPADGQVELLIEDECHELTQGDLIRFRADRPDAFRNASSVGVRSGAREHCSRAGSRTRCREMVRCCVAAMECDMRASLRLTAEQRTIPAPHFRTTGPLTPKTDTGGYHGAMGIAPDLMEGTRKSVLAMIEWIVAEHGLRPPAR